MDICKCLICNHLKQTFIGLNGQKIEVGKCAKNKFNVGDSEGFFEVNLEDSKKLKALKDFSQECNEWDYIPNKKSN